MPHRRHDQHEPAFLAFAFMLGWLIGKYHLPKTDPVIRILIENGWLKEEDF